MVSTICVLTFLSHLVWSPMGGFRIFTCLISHSSVKHVTIWNMSRVHTGEVRPFMNTTVWLGEFLRACVVFDSVSHRRSTDSLSTSFSCDSLNTFTILSYPCRCVIGSHVLPVLSYPIQRTLYRVVFTLSSSTWLGKSSPIPTIWSEIHCIEPSYCWSNTFQSLSK